MAVLLASSAAHADTLYYDGGGTTTTGLGWGTASVWSTDVDGTTNPLLAPINTDDVIFSITGAAVGVVGMNADRAANSLTFNSSVANTLMSHTTSTTSFKLTIGAGGVTINSGAGVVTFGVSTRGTLTTTLGASQSWTHNGANAFSVIQPVNLGANTLTFAGNGAGTASVSGKISGTGALIMNKTGGALTLSGANDYSGGFTLSNGRVEGITGAYAGFGTGTLTLNGGNLHFSGSSTIANDMVWNGTLQFSRPGTGTPIVIFNGNALLTGDFATSQSATQPVSGVVLNGTISATGANKLLTLGTGATTHTVNGGISGSVALTKSGTALLSLNAANNFSGPLTVSDGTVTMRSPSTIGGLSVTAAKTFIYAPTAAGALNINGTYTLGSAVTANTALGGTANQSVIAATGAASLAGTGVVDIRTTAGVSPEAGTHNLITAASGLTGGTYTLGKVYNNTDFTVSNFTRSGTAISVDVASATALSGDVYWKGGLAGTAGVWSASNGSTQSNWQVTDGVNQPLAPGATADLVFSTATSPGTMAGMTLGANVTVRTLTVNNTATAFGLGNDVLNSTLTITPSSSSTGITVGAGVQAVSISAPVALGAAQTWTNNSTNTLTVSGGINNGGNLLVISGSGNTTLGAPNGGIVSGGGGLTMNGTGRLQMGAGNTVPIHTYSGTTTLNGGVTMFSLNNMGSGNLILNGGTFEAYWGGTGHDFLRPLGGGAGQVQIIGGASGFALNGSTSGSVILGNNANNEAVWGAANEAGNVNATGFFNPSTLVLQTQYSQGSSAITFQNKIDLNGTTRTIQANAGITGAASSTLSGVIRNTASTPAGITKTGTGLLVLSAANTFNGATTIDSGILSLTNALALQNSALDTTNSVAGSASAGLRTNQTTLTLGGLTGNKNFAATGGVFTTTSGGYGSVTAITLNPASGSNLSYSGNIENGAVAGTALTKSGAGTQALSGTNSYTGLTTVSNGTLQFGKQVSLYNNTTTDWTAAKINVKNGGTLAFNVGGTGEFTTGDITTLLTNLAASSSATNGMNAGSNLGFDTTNASGGTFVIADLISNSTGTSGGTRGLTKLGVGTLVLSNDNDYTGATNVNGGTLLVNGNSSAATGAVTVASTATLGGIGTVGGAVTANGTVAPGDSLGTLTINSSLVLASTSTLAFELTAGNQAVGGGFNDLIAGVSDLTLDGVLNVNSSALSAGTWRLINYSGTLTDNTLSLGTITLADDHFATIDTGTANQVNLVVAAVPEPASLALLGLGGLGLLQRRRRNSVDAA